MEMLWASKAIKQIYSLNMTELTQNI